MLRQFMPLCSQTVSPWLNTASHQEEDAEPRKTEVNAERVKMPFSISSLPYIGAWMASSMAMMLFNKSLFRGGFRFGSALVLMHQICIAIVFWLYRLLIQQSSHSPSCRVNAKSWMCCFLPIGIMQALAMTSQQKAIALCSVHFVVMVSAVKPVLVSLLQIMLGLSVSSGTQLKILFIVSLGVMLSVAGEAEFNLFGLACLILAQVTESIRTVLIQRVFSANSEHQGLDPSAMLAYSSPAAIVGLLPLVFLFDEISMDLSGFLQPGVPGLLMNTALALLVSFQSNQVIQKTDALVLTLSGIVKDFVTVFMSAYIFSATLTIAQITGYAVSVLFINVFREFKRQEETFKDSGLLEVTAAVFLPSWLTCFGNVSEKDAKAVSGCQTSTVFWARSRYRHIAFVAGLLSIAWLGAAVLKVNSFAGFLPDTGWGVVISAATAAKELQQASAEETTTGAEPLRI